VKPTEEDKNKTEALYLLQINPKGWMQSWLVNLLFVDEPINIFKRVNDVFKKEENK
jgi:hypothetical protein